MKIEFENSTGAFHFVATAEQQLPNHLAEKAIKRQNEMLPTRFHIKFNIKKY